MVRVIWLCLVMTLPCFAQAQILLPHSKDGKFGFVNQSGTWVVQPIFDRVKNFSKRGQTIGLKNDSLFIIYKTGSLISIDNVKDVKFFEKHCAIQNFGGKWAITDTMLNPVSDYVYNGVEFLNGYYLVSKDGLMGLLNVDLKQEIDCQYNSLRFISPFFLYGKQSKNTFYFSTANGIKPLVTKDNRLQYGIRDRNLILSSKSETRVYNLKGDSVYFCTQCNVVNSVKDLLLVENKNSKFQEVIGAEDGKLIHVNNDTFGILTDAVNGFMFDRVHQRIITCANPKTNLFDTLKIAMYTVVDTSNLIVYVNNAFGVVTFNGEIIVPFKYQSISELSNKHYLCKDLYQYDIIKKVDGSFAYAITSFSQIQATESSILITNNKNGATMFALDTLANIVDSFKMKDFAIFNVGTRAGFTNNATITLGNNTSKSKRWFLNSKRNVFGLYGFKDGDTLIRGKFETVIGINDSIDIVSVRSSKFPSIDVKGLGRLNFVSRYGIVNNNTGKYVFPPILPYINTNMLLLDNATVLTVVLPNGKYCLLDLQSLSLIKASICDYITSPKEGYMRMLYQPYFVAETHKEFVNNKRFKRLINPNEFQNKGYFNYGNQVAVSGYSRGVNLCDVRGRIVLNQRVSLNYSYMDEGRYGKFITYNTKDSAGVLSANAQILVPNVYNKIWRLKQNDSFFVLQKNNVRYGYVDADGNEITHPIYTQSYAFNDGYAWSRISDMNFAVDRNGNAEFIYSGVLKPKAISNGIASKKVKNGWQLIDVNGNKISDQTFKNVMPFVNEVAAVQTKKGWGIINSNGDWVVEPNYKSYMAQNKHSLVLSDDNNCFFFDNEGKLLTKQKIKGVLKYANDSMYSEYVSNQYKYYFSDGSKFDNGKKYKAPLITRNDSVFLVKYGRVFVMDMNGKVESKLKHKDGINYIKRGKLDISLSDKWSTVVKVDILPAYNVLTPDIFGDSTKSFKVRSPQPNMKVMIKNDHLQYCYKNNAFVFKLGNKMVLSDSTGNVLSDEEFLDITFLNDKYYRVTIMNDLGIKVSGIIDNLGMWVLPAKYDYIDVFKEDIAVYGIYRTYKIANINGTLITANDIMDVVPEKGYIHLISDVGSAWWKPDGTFVTGFSK